MKVILYSHNGSILEWYWRILFRALLAGVCSLLLATGILRAETFNGLEAVDANGVSTWNGGFPIVLTGVLLTDPNEMLDTTPNFLPWDDGANIYNMGGQWQVFVQTCRRWLLWRRGMLDGAELRQPAVGAA